MSGHEQDTDIRDSTPGSTGPERAAGGMGVSSERVGPTGPGQEATDGVKDTSAAPVDEDVAAGAVGRLRGGPARRGRAGRRATRASTRVEEPYKDALTHAMPSDAPALQTRAATCLGDRSGAAQLHARCPCRPAAG